MINKEITFEQKILNNAVYKQDFTFEIESSTTKNGRYIVSCYSIYKGFNPSIHFNLLSDISTVVNKTDMFDSIGGWLNPETNEYSLDANMHFWNISFALKFAKANNQVAIFDKENNELIYLNSKKQ